MSTFPTPSPTLTRQITSALAGLRAALYDGNASAVSVAAARLDRLIDKYGPAQHTLAETFPELDARLRVNWRASR
jgi:hypothetical protein